MSTESKQKDRWDIVEIIGKILLVPILVGVLAFLGEKQLQKGLQEGKKRLEEGEKRIQLLEEDLKESKSNREVFKSFAELYASEKVSISKRRLSIHLIAAHHDSKIRQKLSDFALWDTLERMLRDEKWEYGENNPDCRLIADILYADKNDSEGIFTIDRLVTECGKRWGKKKTYLAELFSLVRQGYIGANVGTDPYVLLNVEKPEAKEQ